MIDSQCHAPPGRTAVQDLVHELLVAFRLPGASVATVSSDGSISHWAVGFSDAGQRRPMQPYRHVWLASVSKIFTALLVLLVCRRHRISLDTPITRFCASCAAAPTIHQLLTHTGGASTRVPGWRSRVDRGGYALTLGDTAERVGAELGTPGEWIYSNSGYMLLGRMVEIVEGRDFPAVLREILLERLCGRGIAHLLEMTPAELERCAPTLRVSAEGGIQGQEFPPSFTVRNALPTGGLMGNAAGLTTLMRLALFDEGDADVLFCSRQMLTPRVEMPGFSQGFGWFLSGDERPRFWHNGSTGVFVCGDLATGSGVALLCPAMFRATAATRTFQSALNRTAWRVLVALNRSDEKGSTS